MLNPESMRPTLASNHERVVEANGIVMAEAKKVLEETRGTHNTVLFESAKRFVVSPSSTPRRLQG